MDVLFWRVFGFLCLTAETQLGKVLTWDGLHKTEWAETQKSLILLIHLIEAQKLPVHTLSAEKVPLMYFPARQAHETQSEGRKPQTFILGLIRVFSASLLKDGENEQSVFSLLPARGTTEESGKPLSVYRRLIGGPQQSSVYTKSFCSGFSSSQLYLLPYKSSVSLCIFGRRHFNPISGDNDISIFFSVKYKQ